MAAFSIGVLSRDEIMAVYPLVREAVPALELSSWLRFARQLTASRRGEQCGIVAARREGRTFPSGLFCYRVENDLTLGRVLVADHFVAVDLLDPGAVLAALVEELDELASRLGCTAVRSLVHGGTSDPAESLDAAGHRPEDSMLLLKRLRNKSRGLAAGQGGFAEGSAAATR
jgi:hypothetical protein